MKHLLLVGLLVAPVVALAQPAGASSQSAQRDTLPADEELTLPRRTRFYQQLRDTAAPQAAVRFPYKPTVVLVQPATAGWARVRIPNHWRCKAGVTYPPDPVYYISAATLAKARRSRP